MKILLLTAAFVFGLIGLPMLFCGTDTKLGAGFVAAHFVTAWLSGRTK